MVAAAHGGAVAYFKWWLWLNGSCDYKMMMAAAAAGGSCIELNGCIGL